MRGADRVSYQSWWSYCSPGGPCTQARIFLEWVLLPHHHPCLSLMVLHLVDFVRMGPLPAAADCVQGKAILRAVSGEWWTMSSKQWAVTFLEYWNVVKWNKPYDHGVELTFEIFFDKFIDKITYNRGWGTYNHGWQTLSYKVCMLGMGLGWLQIVIWGGLSPTCRRPQIPGLMAAVSFQIGYKVCRLGMGLAWFQVVIWGGLSPTRIRPRTRGLKALGSKFLLCLKLVVPGRVSAFQVGWLLCKMPLIRVFLALGFAVWFEVWFMVVGCM